MQKSSLLDRIAHDTFRSMNTINFGIVGCGKIFDRHANAILSTKGAKIVAVSDKNSDRLQSVQKVYGLDKAYTNYEEMLEDPAVDMVVICTPSGMHASMSVNAIDHNKHVLCEKPMAMSVKDAQKIIQLARAKDRHFFEVKQNRYSPAIQILKLAIVDGFLGKILLGNATVRWNRNQDYYNQSDWFGTIAMDGGVVLNQALHHIDLLYWMMGDPKSVIAKTAVLNHAIEAPDTALAIIQFESGALGNLEITTCAEPTNIEGSITIMGDKGTIKVGGKSLDAFDIWNVKGYEKPEIPASILTNHACIYRDIVTLMSGEKLNVMIDGKEGIKSLLLAENILLSSRLNAEVAFNLGRKVRRISREIKPAMILPSRLNA